MEIVPEHQPFTVISASLILSLGAITMIRRSGIEIQKGLDRLPVLTALPQTGFDIHEEEIKPPLMKDLQCILHILGMGDTILFGKSGSQGPNGLIFI